MGMNQTPMAERVHIAFFGRRNAGKSSVMNAITGQNMAIVSEVAGTTTDPVYKSMELLPLGPVVMIDTPGLDDRGELGLKRVKKSYQVLNKADIAILVIDGSLGMTREDREILARIQKKQLPYLIVCNKADLIAENEERDWLTESCVKLLPEENRAENVSKVCLVSALEGIGIQNLKDRIAGLIPKESESAMLDGVVSPHQHVLLVVPIDKAAPKGRLILPQQQTIRALLDMGCATTVVRDTELAETLSSMSTPPSLVITDSQAFGKVAEIVPEEIQLTSFSILFARYKGNLEQTIRGVKKLDELSDGDRVLISEGCTHHRQCGDIGTEKLPKWIGEYTGKKLEYTFTSGGEFEEELQQFALVIHCGACMLNEREMKYRLAAAEDAGVPMTNYGIAIAYMNGILKRSMDPIPGMSGLLKN